MSIETAVGVVVLKKKVLVVEDDESIWRLYREVFKRFGERLEVLAATTIEEARATFRAHPDIAVVAMDYQVPGLEQSNTLELVKEFRRTFDGPMIAISNQPNDRKTLMEYGCSINCGGKDWEDKSPVKGLLPQEIGKILGIQGPQRAA